MVAGKDAHLGKQDNNKDTITFEVLQLIKEAQSQHGLKHGDYHRYRGYCSRRLERIRKSLGFTQSSGSRHRSTYVKKKVTSDMIMGVGAPKAKKDHIRYLYIPLMETERSWAYAMGLKQEANTEPRKRFHLIRKLKRAVIHAQELEKLTNGEDSKCDAKSKLETQAYCAYMNGILFFETEQWAKASEYLKKSQAIYLKLCEVVVDDETAAHYHQKIDELKPTLRYCAFNIGEQGIKAQDFIDTLTSNYIEDEFLSSKLDQLILQTREKQAATLSEVTWLGKSFAVREEKVRSFLLTHQESKKVDVKKLNQLERLLFECRDCVQLLRDSNQDKTPLYCYLLYLRLDLTCRRNLFLIKNIDSPPDVIRPYEVIISTLNDMKSLPYNQYFSSENEIEDLLNELEARVTAYKAFRCYYIGKLDKVGWKEAIALLNRSSQYCTSYLEMGHKDENLKEQVRQLQAKADGEKFNLYANSMIKDSEPVKFEKSPSKSLTRPISERLDDYLSVAEVNSGDLKMANFPPQYQPIACKPLFFDLALNHLKFPSLEFEISKTKPGGLTGMVKGWLWRK
ncbi:signal recognition particle 68 [Brevipalpus obovatus]|uniref:signal recognition particle 68 n=1 Tax=Brevipalpus obovatus TaxID=246614 RepID=UPI003D9F3D3A